MKTKRKHRQRDAYGWGSDPVVEDGDPPVRVPMMLCDSTGWVRPLTGAQVADRLAVRDGQFVSTDKLDLSLRMLASALPIKRRATRLVRPGGNGSTPSARHGAEQLAHRD
jgi:hypothetical protein